MKSRLFILLLLVGSGELLGRVGLGVQAGLWKPSSLDKNPVNPFAPLQGSGPSYGVLVQSPIWQGFALQFCAWGWRYTDGHDENEIRFLNLAMDIKHLLLAQTRVRPYVTYGAAWVWGKERDADLKQTGLSIDLGAGLEGSLTKQWSVGVEYQYLYLILQQKIGPTDNYSGPKLTVKLLRMF